MLKARPGCLNGQATFLTEENDAVCTSKDSDPDGVESSSLRLGVFRSQDKLKCDFANWGSEMIELQRLETQLNRIRGFTGNLYRICNIISSGRCSFVVAVIAIGESVDSFALNSTRV